MLEKCTKQLFALLISAVMAAVSTAAWADQLAANYDPCTGAQLDCAPGLKSITKVKPGPTPAPAVPTIPTLSSAPYKVKSSPGVASRLEGLSQYNPMGWLTDCCLPTPAKGQFWVGPRVTFARISGHARRGPDLASFQTSDVNFDDQLNIKKNGNAIWSIEAMYQFRPRWGIRYSFTPMLLEGSGTPSSAFSFGTQTFAAGTQVFSKWERYQHKAGLVFNLTRSMNSQANLFAEWLNIQDKLTVGAAGTVGASVTWDDTKNMAEIGLEFDKCLKNYHGNTLALSGKGGVAFLNDSLGYEAEAALTYLIPIKTGRFGFIKGGYSYASMKKAKHHEVFSTVMDGPFVQLGFLF
jgi:hypothetical protein